MWLLKTIFSKWITPASYQIWLLVAGVFGVLVIVAKGMMKALWKAKRDNKDLKNELQRAKELNDVKINVTRDDAIIRLRERGDLRDD
jgi:hypothetical protein